MKPKLKFYSDGSIHDDGFNSLKYYELFGHFPLNKEQTKELMINVLKGFSPT